MTRQEIYQQIKSNHLEDSIKEAFNGKNYTNVSTINLEAFLRKHKLQTEKKLSGLTEAQSNAQCNALIVNIIRNFTREHPNICFGEILHKLDIHSVSRNDASQQTLQRINASLNRLKKSR